MAKSTPANGSDGTDAAKTYMAKIAGQVVKEQLEALRVDLLTEVGKAGASVIAERTAAIEKRAGEILQQLSAAVSAIPSAEQIARAAAEIVARSAAQAPAVVMNMPGAQPAAGAQPSAQATMQQTFQDAIGKGIAAFLSDPAAYVVKIKGALGPAQVAFAPGRLTMAQIKHAWEAQPDEFGYIAGEKLPDPLVELMPQQTMRAYQMGAAAMAQAMRSSFKARGGDPSALPDVDVPEPVTFSTPMRQRPKLSASSTADSKPAIGPATASASPAGPTKLRDLVVRR